MSDRYIRNTDEYERALSILLTPDGRRISELANREHTQVSEEILRKVASHLARDKLILIQSDGKKDDPRIYRNHAMGFFERVWSVYAAHQDEEKIRELIQEDREQIERYKERTGFDTSMELREAISDEETSLSHINTEGEIFWDICSPWSELEHNIAVYEFILDNFEMFERLTSDMPFDVEGGFGDFSDVNAVKAKLGLQENLPTDATIDEHGDIHRDDEPVL